MADQTPKRIGASRLMRMILVVSLALNLAVVGLFVGAAVSGRWSSGPPPHFEFGLGPFGRALTPEERRDIRRSLLRDRSTRGLDLRGQMDQMIAALQADAFDPDDIRALMAEQSGRNSQMRSHFHDVLLQVISDMTPERRQAFAAQLTEAMSRDRPRREKPSGG